MIDYKCLSVIPTSTLCKQLLTWDNLGERKKKVSEEKKYIVKKLNDDDLFRFTLI